MTQTFEDLPTAGENRLPSEVTLWGHPKGLWVLVLTEGWVAFSLYGMLALLVIYMQDYILRSEHSVHVWGMTPLLSLVRTIYAPVGLPAMAASIMGLFMAVVAALPLLGSILADRYIGRTRIIIIGALLMTLGHGLMSFESSFVVALLCLLVGNGCSGSMKAQVGALYAQDDRRRADAYQLYSLGVQVAVIISPLLCSFLGKIAWHWGFLCAGTGMSLGLVCYLAGRQWLPPETTRVSHRGKSPSLSIMEKKRVILLIILVFIFAIGAIPNEEIFAGYLLWGKEHYQLTFWGYDFPVSTLLSLDGLISSVTAVAVLWFWRAFEKRHNAVPEIWKVFWGSLIAAFGPVCLALAQALYPALHSINLWWGVAFHTINDIGFSMVFAVGMALYSRIAPMAVNTLLVSLFTLHLAFSNLLVGKLATLVTRIPGTEFWLLHGAAALLATLIFLLCALFCRRLLMPQEER
ncbi:MFS transporter [Acetobacteraceae bacterium ESL0709]|nr:MFS transporter [Acetobacteraceae bacterium ESL0697]MDF7678171.1 MFS transporter [Acetobacteraceae bacterium ESL0709]